ncbi:uncharacterized protein LOC124434768 [Xenia sp. Carnegie-2017]|uniref:uncharacterized protein LOC124433655 n=1 Tax=Xenia sp. Carnegie-2017 TaxID=2897299 RepID=UPI001F03C0B3|nr:uncharacterized protein LOC124433655 [Xenia sp. Carnegie-2017]XP_046840627.1 uncharacterized protein LOC124434768 [Xenia sp. Carnegie-2017]
MGVHFKHAAFVLASLLNVVFTNEKIGNDGKTTTTKSSNNDDSEDMTVGIIVGLSLTVFLCCFFGCFLCRAYHRGRSGHVQLLKMEKSNGLEHDKSGSKKADTSHDYEEEVL